MFSTYFELPQANFQVKYATGDSWPYISTTPPTKLMADNNLSGEVALDTQWSHAMAPKTKLFLVEAQDWSLTNMSNAMQAAQHFVSTNGGGEVSMSWQDWGNDKNSINSFDQIIHNTSYPNIIYLASTGDYGWPTYPAGSSYVIAVGGTTINRNADDQYVNETAWNDTYNGFYDDPKFGTTGSDAFVSEPLPSYQNIPSVINSVGTQHRGVPDVSLFTTANGPKSNGINMGVPIVINQM